MATVFLNITHVYTYRLPIVFSRVFFCCKKTREKKTTNNYWSVWMLLFFFRMFVITSVCARQEQDAYAITTKERERGRRKQLEGHVLYARKHGYSRKISLELKKRCNKSLTLSSAIVYL